MVFDKSPEVSSIIAMKSNDILQKSIINFKLKNISDVYNFTLKQLKLAQNNLFEIQDSLANFKDSNKNIKSILFSNQLERLETEYNISKNIYNELAISKERIAIDVRKNTPIFTIINNVVVPNEKHTPTRSIICLYFLIFGFTIISFWLIIKDNFITIKNHLFNA